MSESMRSSVRRPLVFSAAGISSLATLWHRSLNRRIQERGSQIVGRFCCPGWDTVGPYGLWEDCIAVVLAKVIWHGRHISPGNSERV